MVLGLLHCSGMAIHPRRSPRIECALPVHWTRWKTRLSGDARRCNAHGLFVATPHDAQVGYMMDLTIVMPWGELSCTAVPRFIGESPDGRGIGIEFHVMDRGDREMWHAYYRRATAAHGVRVAPSIL